MTKVGKLVSGLIATQVFYAGYFFLSKGSFLFPLPLNEVIIFTAIIISLYYERFKIGKAELIILSIYALIELICSQFLLRLILSVENYQFLVSTFFFDLTVLIKISLLLFLFINWSREEVLNLKILIPFYIILTGVLFFINSFQMLSTLVLFISAILLRPIYSQKASSNLWILILFDLFTTYWMTDTFLF